MNITYKTVEVIMKVFFSAVLLQLACIAIMASRGTASPHEVCSYIEYAAAGAVCTLGGGLSLEYALRYCEK